MVLSCQWVPNCRGLRRVTFTAHHFWTRLRCRDWNALIFHHRWNRSRRRNYGGFHSCILRGHQDGFSGRGFLRDSNIRIWGRQIWPWKFRVGGSGPLVGLRRPDGSGWALEKPRWQLFRRGSTRILAELWWTCVVHFDIFVRVWARIAEDSGVDFDVAKGLAITSAKFVKLQFLSENGNRFGIFAPLLLPYNFGRWKSLILIPLFLLHGRHISKPFVKLFLMQKLLLGFLVSSQITSRSNKLTITFPVYYALKFVKLA